MQWFSFQRFHIPSSLGTSTGHTDQPGFIVTSSNGTLRVSTPHKNIQTLIPQPLMIVITDILLFITSIVISVFNCVAYPDHLLSNCTLLHTQKKNILITSTASTAYCQQQCHDKHLRLSARQLPYTYSFGITSNCTPLCNESNSTLLLFSS